MTERQDSDDSISNRISSLNTRLVKQEHRLCSIREDLRSYKAGTPDHEAAKQALKRWLFYRLLLPFVFRSAAVGGLGAAVFAWYLAWDANRIAAYANTLATEANVFAHAEVEVLREQNRLNVLQERQRRILEARSMLELTDASDEYLRATKYLRSNALATYVTLKRYDEPNVRIDLRELHLEYIELRQVDLHGANLSGAHLHDAAFIDVNLAGAMLEAADLLGASFIGTNLGGASLRDASNINRSEMRNCNLFGAWLRPGDLMPVDKSALFWPELMDTTRADVMAWPENVLAWPEDAALETWLEQMSGCAGLRIFQINAEVLGCLAKLKGIPQVHLLDRTMEEGALGELVSALLAQVSNGGLEIITLNAENIADEGYAELRRLNGSQSLVLLCESGDAVQRLGRLHAMEAEPWIEIRQVKPGFIESGDLRSPFE